MDFVRCIRGRKSVLMEGALGERLKREYRIKPDNDVAWASLIYTERGRTALKELWNEYIGIAQAHRLPLLATTPTRRANRERVPRAGFSSSLLSDNVAFLKAVRQDSGAEMYVGGLMGCRGDAYTGEDALPQAEARKFHRWQAGLLSSAGVDFLFAGIMPTLPEAAGMAQAMEESGIPYILSFTIRRDGRIIDGSALSDAIAYIDEAVRIKPVCYMANCVHPAIVYDALSQPFNRVSLLRDRFWGLQANTSPLPYHQLDGARDLHCSDPARLAEEMLKLREISDIRIFGGCCGTDGRHMEQIARRLS